MKSTLTSQKAMFGPKTLRGKVFQKQGLLLAKTVVVRGIGENKMANISSFYFNAFFQKYFNPRIGTRVDV